MNNIEKKMASDGIVGIDSAVRSVQTVVSEYDGVSHLMLLVVGPPGSGKTTVCAQALAASGYAIYNPVSGDSLAKEIVRVVSFCSTVNSVGAMLKLDNKKRKAVFVDDLLPDSKSVCAVVDAVRKLPKGALVVVCTGRSNKAPTVVRRADVVVTFHYPEIDRTVAHLTRRFAELDAGTIRTCAENAAGCVPKAAQLCVGELYGTKSVDSPAGVDCSIFDDVKRALSLAVSGRGFKDVEIAISSEPSMCVMILRESTPRASPETRAAFLAYSRTPPGSWIGSVASTACFMEIALREQAQLANARMIFPRCYTTASSRACALKKKNVLTLPA